ncbi:YpmA family protein [Paenisporosarcina quisquiliarum]|uniref:YpmA family protein n=1 Tax=Paenisporosarcina quisquiliarum TaxID=365346 RepID=UPI00373569F4
MESKIEIISTVTVDYQSDLYKIVDVLNRSLKHQDLMFGLALEKENHEKAVFTIYKT